MSIVRSPVACVPTWKPARVRAAHDRSQLGDALVLGGAREHELARAAQVGVGLVDPGRAVGRDPVGEDLDGAQRQQPLVEHLRARVAREHPLELLDGAAAGAADQQRVRRREHQGHARAERVVGQRVAVDVDLVGREARVRVARDALRQQDADGGGERAAQLVGRQRRQHREHELLGALPQQPDRLARGVAIDHAARRRHGVARDAGQLERARVDPDGVEREVAQDDGVVRRHRVEVLPRRQPGRVGADLVEQREVPSAPADPLARGGARDRLRHELDDVRDRGDRREADVERERREREARGEPVHVRVIDPRQRRSPLQVDHGRAATRQAPDLARRTGAPDPPAADGERLGDAAAPIERVHLAVEQHEVGRPRPGGAARGRGHRERRDGARAGADELAPGQAVDGGFGRHGGWKHPALPYLVRPP